MRAEAERRRLIWLGVAAATWMVAAAPTQTGRAETDVLLVEMRDIAFAPAEVTARVGDRIKWHNDDIVDHTATSEVAGFDVVVPSGQTADMVLTRPGNLPYTCRYHPNMTGRIRVSS